MKMKASTASRRHPRIIALALLASLGCAANASDPFAGQPTGGSSGGGAGGTTPSGMGGTVATGGTSATGGAPAGPDAGGSTGGAPGTGGAPAGGAAKPARMIVLGDSIAACQNVGGKMGADCSARKLYDYVKATYAPALVYENQAVGGAVTADVPARQLEAVKAGPGAVLLLVYVGGNDLAKYIFSSDAAATKGYETDLPGVLAAWNQVFAFFDDKSKFPDGYRAVMNSQYNPFDDCTAVPYNVSAQKFELLHQFNGELAKLAQAKGASLTDQYTPFLGHGHHYNVMRCPHFMTGAAGWMSDLIHPNAAGHEDLFQQWKKTVDALYH
jgi:lysophospholipase L1-like esterase